MGRNLGASQQGIGIQDMLLVPIVAELHAGKGISQDYGVLPRHDLPTRILSRNILSENARTTSGATCANSGGPRREGPDFPLRDRVR